MKDKIVLSINPSYFCNLRCSFCYLSVDQLSSPQTISDELLFERLSTVSAHRLIDHVDLYGGEIALIKPQKLKDLLNVIRLFYKDKINIITNLTVMNQVFLDEDITLSISWDFFAREQHDKVYQNMLELDKDFHILILASEELVHMSEMDLDLMIKKLNKLPRLKTVEIKPFSDNLFHPQAVTFLEHEEWLKKWILKINQFNFDFINIRKIEDSLKKRYSSWSDDHLYITPQGLFAALEFDKDNKEYFLELADFSAYELWTLNEKNKVQNNSYCGNCEYLGSCLSEHLQPVKNLDHSCNGFKSLLSWYRTQQMESV